MGRERFWMFEERVILVLRSPAVVGSESLVVVGALWIGRMFAGWFA